MPTYLTGHLLRVIVSIVLTAALDLNRKSFNWLLFRPRVMVDVDVVDTSTKMLGHKTSLPVSQVHRTPLHAPPGESPLTPDLPVSDGHGGTGTSAG